MSREDIIRSLKLKSGGEVSRCLDELVQCGFLVCSRAMAKKKKDALYLLVDPYTLFYFQFVAPWRGNDNRHWSLNYNAPRVNTWRGLAFERVCIMHSDQIKRALGIQGVEADTYSWQWRSDSPDEKGVQIDMLIDRADGIVDLCEMKYSNEPYPLDKNECEGILHRAEVFRRESGVRKAVHTVIIAANGVARSKYFGNIQNVVDGTALFA